MRALSSTLSLVIPHVKRLLIDDHKPNEVIGLINEHDEETILFIEVSCPPLLLLCSVEPRSPHNSRECLFKAMFNGSSAN